MTARDMVAAAVLVWLIGAIAGWCAGWAGRGEQNRAWHRGVTRQLAQAHAQLADALDELDSARFQRVPAAVHVHVAPSPPWPPPMVTDTTPLVTAMPVLPAEEVQS